MPERRIFASERAVSTTLSYALNLAIAAILVSALLFAAGSTVEDQRQSTAREELRVIGERIAAAFQQADRLAVVGSDPDLRLKVIAPRTVAGMQYTISLDPSADDLVLKTRTPDITVRIPLEIEKNVVESEVRGGDLFIVLEDGDTAFRLGVA